METIFFNMFLPPIDFAPLLVLEVSYRTDYHVSSSSHQFGTMAENLRNLAIFLFRHAAGLSVYKMG